MKLICAITILFNLAFSSIGFAQAWQQTNGPGGSTIQSVAVNSQGDIFVASNAIMRSTDDGKSWMRIALDIPTLPYGTPRYIIQVKPTGELFLMVLTDSVLSGIWRSTDNGTSWTRVRKGVFKNINITPDGSVFAMDGYSALRSTDNGNSWNTVPQNNIIAVLDIWGDKAGHLFLNSDYLYRSTDNGQNWSKVVNGLTGSITSFAEAPSGHLFATIGGVYKNIYESIDAGRTWQTLSFTTLSNNYSRQHTVFITPQGRMFIDNREGHPEFNDFSTDDEGKNWRDIQSYPTYYPDLGLRILTIDKNGNFYGTNANTLFRSVLDSNSTWSHIDVPIGTVSGVTRHPNGNLVAFTIDNVTDAGWIWLSMDEGTRWTTVKLDSLLVDSYNNSAIYTIAIDSSKNILIGTSGFIAISSNAGQNWSRNSTTLTQGVITGINVRNTGEIFASSSTEGIFRSTDNGVTWDQLNIGIKNQSLSSLAVHQNGDVYAGSFNIIYKSTDVGLHWTQLTTNFPAKAGSVSNLVVSTQGNIIAGVDNAGVFWSTDNGATWAQKGTGLFASKINALVSTPSGKVFAATNAGIFFLDITPGANWIQLNSGLTATNVLSLCRDESGRLFAGTDVSGVFSSIQTYNIAHQSSLGAPSLISPANNAVNTPLAVTLAWNAVPSATKYQVTISRSADFLAVDTISGYLTENTFTFAAQKQTQYYWHVQAMNDADVSLFSDSWTFTTGTNADVKANDLSSSLSIYPNPSSSESTVSFSLSEHSIITLEVLDPLGRIFATLAKGEYESGNHEVKFSAGDLASGVYFVRLQTGSISLIKAVEILK